MLTWESPTSWVAETIVRGSPGNGLESFSNTSTVSVCPWCTSPTASSLAVINGSVLPVASNSIDPVIEASSGSVTSISTVSSLPREVSNPAEPTIRTPSSIATSNPLGSSTISKIRSYTSPSGSSASRVRSRLSASPPASMLNEPLDRKSTRLNSSHVATSYAVFCLKKKTTVDVALIHDPSSLGPLFGEVPLVLSGHFHRRIDRLDAWGSRLRSEDTAGGADITSGGL